MRDRKGRKRQGRFLIDGLREVSRAATSRACDLGFEIQEIYVPQQTSDQVRQLVDDMESNSSREVALIETSQAVFEKIAFGKRDDGVLAVASHQPRPLAELTPSATALIAIADGIEKPGNAGAILRTADAAGLEAVVFSDLCSDLVLSLIHI